MVKTFDFRASHAKRESVVLPQMKDLNVVVIIIIIIIIIIIKTIS